MHAFDTYILRTPLLPYNTLSAIQTAGELEEVFREPLLQEALFLASPALSEEIRRKKPDAKALASMYKYLQRASTRCTPFGLFAGCTAVSALPELQPKTWQFSDRRQTRPDMNYLCALVLEIEKQPEIRNALKWFPNTSIYRVGDKIRYTEYAIQNSFRKHQLTAVDYSEYIERVLQAATAGSRIDDLAQLLVSDEVSFDEAKTFVLSLTEAQLLVSELEPAVTGKDYLERILHHIAPIPEAAAYHNSLFQLKGLLDKLNKQVAPGSASQYNEIDALLKPLNVPFDWKWLLQTDMFRDTADTLPQTIGQNLLPAVIALGKLSVEKSNPNLQRFREAFLSRYETREVPLSEVLDIDVGLGFPYADSRHHDLAPLLEGIGSDEQPIKNSDIQWQPVHSLLLRKITHAREQKEMEIRVSDDELNSFSFDRNCLGETFSALCSVYECNDQTGELKLHLQLVTTASATMLPGRFGCGDPKIRALSEAITAHEQGQHPEAILAEIVHLPESRTGNVVFRPVLRNWEIPYLAASGVDEQHQIPVADLMVSVKGDRICLRSRKYNKPVIPKMANAHNYASSTLPVYQFLCELQYQDKPPGLGIDLPFFQAHFSFIPRIVYRNVVLAPASWQFIRKELNNILQASPSDRINIIRLWREKNRMPRYMLLPDSDNELFIDWENELSVAALFDAIRSRDDIRLTEFLFNPEHPLIKTADGAFTNQVVVSYRKSEQIIHSSADSSFESWPEETRPVKRDYLPGSEWLYFKIYCGIKTADRLLSAHIYPLARQLRSDGLVSGFFFIRYADPTDHFRLRFRIAREQDSFTVLQKVYQALEPAFETSLISKVQLDTYQREIERYGQHTIEASETLFEADSFCVLKLISLLDGDSGDSLRWKLGLKFVDTYLKAFGYTPQSIVRFAEMQESQFSLRFNFGKTQRIQMDKRFRQLREEIRHIVDGSYSDSDEITSCYQQIDKLGTWLHSLAGTLKEKSSPEKLSEMISSYIHMNVNRLFRSRQPLHEMMLYSLLQRHYASVLAQQKKASQNNKKAHV